MARKKSAPKTVYLLRYSDGVVDLDYVAKSKAQARETIKDAGINNVDILEYTLVVKESK